MHDFLVVLSFFAMLLAPCVVATYTQHSKFPM